MTVNSHQEESIDGSLHIIILSIFGFTPLLWNQIKDSKRIEGTFFFFLFVVDLLDAIFDLILACKTMMYGVDGEGVVSGIFLFCATILGRVVSGIYGWVMSKEDDNEEHLKLFIFMELSVFFLEDGASILVLAYSTDGMGIVETISMYLTLICSVCYFAYLLVMFIRRELHKECIVVVTASIPIGIFVFQSYILITQVFMSTDDDPPLSGGLEIAAIVVYGVLLVPLAGMIGGMCVYARGDIPEENPRRNDWYFNSLNI